MELENMFYVSEKDWYKLQAWATLAYEEDKNEISGLMTAIPQEDGRIKIGDVEILKQENTSSNTELDGEAVSAYMMKYGMKYNNPDMKFVWWHSHHTMGAFWSGTDEKEIDAWKNNSYSLALVINLKEEYVFRVSFWSMNGLPIEQHVDTTLTIERKEPKINISEKMKKDYSELCSSPTVTTYNHQQGYIRYNPNQRHLWHNQREESLNVESAYVQAYRKMENLQDSFISGEVSYNTWKKEVAAMNKTCETNKLPFRIVVYKLNKSDLLNELMTANPTELFDWEDDTLQSEAETTAWNRSFGGGGLWQ